jgi:hypothetical protein
MVTKLWTSRRARRLLDGADVRAARPRIEYVPGAGDDPSGHRAYFWIGTDNEGCYATISARQLSSFLDSVRVDS